MNFKLNPACLTSAFSLPGIVADKFLNIAGAVQLKVLLFCMRNLTADGIDTQNVAAALKINEGEVCDALNFWAEAGVFIKPETISVQPESEKKRVVALKTEKPSRSEVAQRGSEDKEIAFLLREAQNVFGRTLKASEASTLVWLYDDEGMSSSVILTLLGYAKSIDRVNIGFIERTAIDWINNSVLTVADADSYLNQIALKNSAFSVVSAAFGFEKRMPSKTELELAHKWVNEYNLPREVLREAYNLCIDSTSKFSMPYVKKIIESWHKSGVKTLSDIQALNKKQDTKATNTAKKSGKYSTSNMSDFDKHINGGD